VLGGSPVKIVCVCFWQSFFSYFRSNFEIISLNTQLIFRCLMMVCIGMNNASLLQLFHEVCSIGCIRLAKAALNFSKLCWFLEDSLFFPVIEGKVIFASARRLPWVLPVVCENQSLRCLQRRLCFGDAFVYGTRNLWQALCSNNLVIAIYVVIIGSGMCEC
jgi:hypothetical protein